MEQLALNFSAAQCNPHGVYYGAGVQRLRLGNGIKGWRGCALAEIRVMELEAGQFIQASSIWYGTGGYAEPLTARPYVARYPTRLGAVREALEGMSRYIGNEALSATAGERAKVRRWINSMLAIDDEDELDQLFEEEA